MNPRKRREPPGEDGSKVAQQTTDPPTLGYAVEIVNPSNGRARIWNFFATREAAEIEQAKLAKHGLIALVWEAEACEHRNSRRRFLVWAVLAGFAKPERLTERILKDIEGEES